MSGLLKAIQLSEEIEEAVQEYDWEKVSHLDEIRQQVINSYYREEDIIDSGLTEQLKQINDSIRDRLVQIQKQTRNQQVDFKNAQKASKAYENNQR